MAIHDANYYLDHIEQAAGGDIDARLHGIGDGFAILNDAGRYLCNMHEWKWQNRPPLNLDFVADQNYVDLPLDFKMSGHIQVTNTLISTVKMVGMPHIMFLRGSALSYPFFFFVALSWPQPQKGSPPSGPRLEMWPTPVDSEIGAMTIFYDAKWTEITEGSDVPMIPTDLEFILIELCRTITRTYTDPRLEFKRTELLGNISKGQPVQDLKELYGVVQHNYGMPTGGVVSPTKRLVYRPHSRIGTDAE